MKTKLSLGQGVIIPILLLLFMGAMGVAMVWIGFKEHKYGLSLCSIIWIGISFLIVIFYKNALKNLYIDKQGIVYDDKFRNWSEIKKIYFTGKKAIKLSFGQSYEGLSISFNDNSKITLLDLYFSNIWEIKQAIKYYRKGLNSNFSPITINESSHIHDLSYFTKYSGNFIFSFNSLLLNGFFLFTLYLVLFVENKHNQSEPYIALLIINILIFLHIKYQTNYFYLNNSTIVIKNQLWTFKNSNYDIKDILEVVIETPHKMSDSLRIVTKDYKTHLYPAGSLKNSTWKKFIKDLKTKGVKVRNETIF